MRRIISFVSAIRVSRFTSTENNAKILLEIRSKEFDMDETFGEVQAGDLEGVIEVTSRLNQISAYDLSVSSSPSLCQDCCVPF